MPQMCPKCSHDNPGKQAGGSCGNCSTTLRGLLGFRERVNGYEAQKVLGCGGFSAVYLAKDLKHDHDVALKELFDLGEEDIKRFEHEAAILSRLSHPQLPRFYEHFEHEGKRYLVMEFIRGQSLADIVVEKRQREEKVREVVAFGWALQLCDAVAYLHKEGIIHRDIKPDNVRLTPTGEICLVDLGIAKRISPGGPSVTMVHGLTQGYAPIEQYAAKASKYKGRTDERTDIYALGATLYTVVTNLIPPDARALVAGTEILPPIQAVHPQISNQFTMTIERAMELMPEDRFASVVDMMRALGEKVPHFEPVLEVSPTELDLGSVDRGESKYKDLRTIAKRILSIIAARLRSFAAHTVKRQIRKFRSGSFSISCSDNESRPVGIAADERDFLFVAWDNGEIQAYRTNSEDPIFARRIVNVVDDPRVADLRVLDISTYKENESSGCYVLLKLKEKKKWKPSLFRVNWDEGVSEINTALKTWTCCLACYESQLYLLGKAEGRSYLYSFNDGQREPIDDCKTPHGVIAGRDNLFVVGESKKGQHCIWVRSRSAKGLWQCYSWRNEIYATRNPEDERLYVSTHEPGERRALVLLDPSSPEAVILYPQEQDFCGGSAISANLDCLFMLDSDSSKVFWYGHNWLGLKSKHSVTSLLSKDNC